ncbi:hypothetical protein [Lysobacter gummosus]
MSASRQARAASNSDFELDMAARPRYDARRVFLASSERSCWMRSK